MKTGSDAALKSVYETHQWFKLRDAIDAAADREFYEGAVACAFNDFKQALPILSNVIKTAPGSGQASEARGLLIYLYQRAGRFPEAVSQIDQLLKLDPANANLKSARAFFRSLSQYPAQTANRGGYCRIRYRIHDGNLFLPLAVNGKRADYILDTGANFSTISESEAKRLGLTIHSSAAKGMVATGAQVGFQTACAGRLSVGKVHLRHVIFLVARDDQQPFADLPLGQRGVLGMPVLLALNTVRWSTDGIFETRFDSPSSRVQESNLCFDGADIATETTFNQHKLNLHLDTGASGTVLFPRFAEEFAELLRGGKKELKKIAGVGHAVEVDSISLPLLSLRIGGFDATLRPATVLLKNVGSPWFHGRVGLDLLCQARRVSISFQSMKLTLQ